MPTGAATSVFSRNSQPASNVDKMRWPSLIACRQASSSEEMQVIVGAFCAIHAISYHFSTLFDPYTRFQKSMIAHQEA